MDLNAFLSPNLQQKIETITDVLVGFFRGDRGLRATQSENEPAADGMQQGTNANGTETVVLPNGGTQQQVPFTIFFDGQDVTAKKYSYIVVIIESVSGAGRYSLQANVLPKQDGTQGHEIPAGGTTLTIPGLKNIKNFKMCPETGQSLKYSIQGFV